ncbi:MAG: DUF3570 domain-containing protein [Eudoraea sp.]|nr:DUF3570 domain-containing protein [Eudoraea sp.]
MKPKRLYFILIGSLVLVSLNTLEAQETYKKRVLEVAEVAFLSSYYTQDGSNAAVSGGIGTEDLTDATGTFVVSIPLNDDDVLTVDAGISAYTSASSSNVNPFDGSGPADAFQASSGASGNDIWSNLTLGYSHNSDDRNTIWTAKLAVATEYDYFSLGLGGSFTRLFNEKNTELGINTNIYLDKWNAIYPTELRPFISGGDGINDPFFSVNTISGNPNYDPSFTAFDQENRNSYSLGVNLSQILSKKLQGALIADLVLQEGLLSTPFQRVYFGDVADSFIQNFQLADDIERLPETRWKVALGGRLNYYLNEIVVIRSYYRYYSDDWGIRSHTANLEIPVKISDSFTLYPSYRYYTQTAADYFAAYEENLSSDIFYTSDYDLSEYNANQFGMGITYTDIFTNLRIWKIGLKQIDLKFDHYERNSGLAANIASLSFTFLMD